MSGASAATIVYELKSPISKNTTNSKNITLEKPEQKLEIQQKGMQR